MSRRVVTLSDPRPSYQLGWCLTKTSERWSLWIERACVVSHSQLHVILKSGFLPPFLLTLMCTLIEILVSIVVTIFNGGFDLDSCWSLHCGFGGRCTVCGGD